MAGLRLALATSSGECPWLISSARQAPHISLCALCNVIMYKLPGTPGELSAADICSGCLPACPLVDVTFLAVDRSSLTRCECRQCARSRRRCTIYRLDSPAKAQFILIPDAHRHGTNRDRNPIISVRLGSRRRRGRPWWLCGELARRPGLAVGARRSAFSGRAPSGVELDERAPETRRSADCAAPRL